jgi:thioredoxin 2
LPGGTTSGVNAVATDRVFVKCGACSAVNRVALEKIGRTGHCGSCRADLPTGGFYADAPLEVGEAHFDLVTRMSGSPVLVDFWAPMCGPCMEMVPVLDAFAHEMSGRALVVKVDAQTAPVLAARFGIEAVPTLVILRSGLEVDRVMGALPLPALRARLERFLN